MDSPETMSPVSPVLLAGRVFGPLPGIALQPLLDRIMGAMVSRHPDLFERLSCLERPLYLIDPVDLPFLFALTPDPQAPCLRIVIDSRAIAATATIRGPLMSLIDLLEGRVDGDALFFSRGLVVEGDIQAVVALRNAVDDAQINLADDVLCLLGPFARPAGVVIDAARGLFIKARDDLKSLRDALAPSPRRDSTAKPPEL